MTNNSNITITVFEHQTIRLGDGLNDELLKKLQEFYGVNGVPYYSLIHKGVRFCEYVGVLQIGKYIIEILPKADNTSKKDSEWRNMLIDMLKAVGLFDVTAPSSSNLSIKSNSILDLYIKLFINQTEKLLHQGLIKTYHKEEENSTALKGSIIFGKNIQKNIVHQERFYVRHTIYDNKHPLNCVLFKTLKLLQKINTNQTINNSLSSLLLNFPEMPAIKTDEAFFNRLEFNRKTESYRSSISIARMLLLNYHPDLKTGSNDVLALMFDMNLLWEKFVFASIKKHISKYLPSGQISAQTNFNFWKPNNGYAMRLKPDIVITKSPEDYFILDTKWKNLNGYKPKPDDLRQMYTYSKFHKNAITALLYPGESKQVDSLFLDLVSPESKGLKCAIFEIEINNNIKDWQENIASLLLGYYIQ